MVLVHDVSKALSEGKVSSDDASTSLVGSSSEPQPLSVIMAAVTMITSLLVSNILRYRSDGVLLFSLECNSSSVHNDIMLNHPISSGFLSTYLLALILNLAQWTTPSILAQNNVFSGPQPGEFTTPFNTVELRGESQGSAVDPVHVNRGKPTALVFVHGIERSMVPLMRVIDTFGSEYREKIITNWVFLSDDPVTSRQRLPQVGRSIKIQGRMLLSSDGIEGPGNYGLNKDCLLTILTAKDNKVTANFALIQPGIADAKEVVEALSSLIGLDAPPSVESLTPKVRMANGRNMRKGENARARKRGQNMQEENAHNEGRKLPGAAPTDSQLVGYLRQFIQKSNSDEQVDKVLNQVRSYIKDNENLIKQAVNGWTRVLHVKYGTDYAQAEGDSFVNELRKQLRDD